MRQLWRERVLGRYVRGEIARDEAIEAVGIDWVEPARSNDGRSGVGIGGLIYAVTDAGPLIHLAENEPERSYRRFADSLIL